MKEFKTTSRNIGFDITKLFYSFLIIFFHTGFRPGTYFYTCCEGFFFISGIYLIQSATTFKVNTFKYIFKKWLSFLPYLIISGLFFFCANILIASMGPNFWSDFSQYILKLTFVIFPVDLSLSMCEYVMWFVTALMVTSLIIYPLMKHSPKIFPYIGFAIAICLYIPIYVYKGDLDTYRNIIWHFLPLGFLRAASGLLLGSFIWKVCSLISNKKDLTKIKHKDLLFWMLFILVVMIFTIFTYIGYLGGPSASFIPDFVLVIMLFVNSFLIYLLGQFQYFKKTRFCNDLFKYLANLSFIFFLTHPIWINIFNQMKMSASPKLLFTMICTIGVSIALYFVIKIIQNLFKKWELKWNFKHPKYSLE